MKQSFIYLFLMLATTSLFAGTNNFFLEKSDAVVTDSLDYYQYHVSHMAISLNSTSTLPPVFYIPLSIGNTGAVEANKKGGGKICLHLIC